MKTTLSLGLIVAAASTLLACSSDEDKADRNNGGTGPIAGAGGQTASGGTGGTATGGSSGTGAGGAAGAGPELNLGEPLEISPTPDPDGTGPLQGGATVADPTSASAIDGAVILAQSPQPGGVETAHREGALCMRGTTAAVIMDNYGEYWGAELSLDLNLQPPEGTVAPPADAGADAGSDIGEVPAPWPYGNVIGFSFKIEGEGLPGSLRFKGLPFGHDSETNTFCNQLTGVAAGGVTLPPLVAGATHEVLFSDITFECWTAGNPTLTADPLPVMTGTPAMLSTQANARELQNIGWQVNAEPTAAFPFDFCVTELRPILAAP